MSGRVRALTASTRGGPILQMPPPYGVLEYEVPRPCRTLNQGLAPSMGARGKEIGSNRQGVRALRNLTPVLRRCVWSLLPGV